MEKLIYSFLGPYFNFCYAVGSGFLHNIEGYFGGLIFSYVSISVDNLLYFFCFIAILIMIISMIFSCCVAFRYSRLLFFFVFLLWLAPGGLGIFFPEAFGDGIVYDTNFVVWGSPNPRPTGSMDEQVCALILSMVFGWAVMSVIAEFFAAGKRFRMIFEFSWLFFGLNAALFATYDSQLQLTKYAISERDKDAVRIVNVYEERVSQLKKLCDDGLSEVVPNACRWAAPALVVLGDLKIGDDIRRIDIGFPTVVEFLAYGSTFGDDKTASAVEQEIEAVNQQACSQKHINLPCMALPDKIGVLLFEKRIINDLSSPVMFKPFPVVELAQALYETSKDGDVLFDKLRNEVGLTNLRWLIFMFFAMLTGCKAALHIREIYRDDQGKRLQVGHWGPTIFYTVPRAIWTGLTKIVSGLAWSSHQLMNAFSYFAICIKRIAGGWHSGNG